MTNVTTNAPPSPLLSLLVMARDTIGEVCNMRETMLDIADAYHKELMEHIRALSDSGYADQALDQLTPERQAILMEAIGDMLEMLPPTQLEKINELADEARRDLERLRKIQAKLDTVLEGLAPP